MRIAIDFDKTIVEDKFPLIGEAREGALEGIRALHEMGHKLFLWTCREGESLQNAIDWLNENGVGDLFTAFNDNDEETKINFGHNSRKLTVDLYIDDKMLFGLPPWEKIVEMVKRMDGDVYPSLNEEICEQCDNTTCKNAIIEHIRKCKTLKNIKQAIDEMTPNADCHFQLEHTVTYRKPKC